MKGDSAFSGQIRQPHLRLLQLGGPAFPDNLQAAGCRAKENKSSQESDREIARRTPDVPPDVAKASDDLHDLDLAEDLAAGAWFGVDPAKIAANVFAPNVVAPSSGSAGIFGHDGARSLREVTHDKSFVDPTYTAPESGSELLSAEVCGLIDVCG